MWQHNYEPIAGSLSLSTVVAAIPIVVLFVMLGVLRKPAWMSALTALVFHSPLHYGNLITYMRIKGIVPPETERAQRPRPAAKQ